MAIKGKKKSQNRGRQGQRRPAAAPRPVYSTGARRPWYRTAGGRVLAGLIAGILLIALFVVVANAQNASQERAQLQEGLESYTGQVQALTERIDGPVGEMAAAPATTDGDLKALAKDAKKWTTELQAVQAETLQAPPVEGTETASAIFQQAIALYLSAAQTYALVPTIEGDTASEMLLRAEELRDNATALWETAINELDDERLEAGLEPSGLSAPGVAPEQAVPTALPSVAPSFTVPLDEDGGEQDAGDKDRKQGRGGKGGKRDSGDKRGG